MRNILFGACAALAVSFAPAYADPPTTGDVYLLEFLEGSPPSQQLAANDGRYCGRWMNNGLHNGVMLFKLKGRTRFEDLAMDDRVSTECNDGMKSLYQQVGASQRAQEPMPQFIKPFPSLMRPRMINPPGSFKKK